MSLNAEAIEFLIERGFGAGDILELARKMERKRDNTNAERQARYREKRKAKKGNARYNNGVTPLNDNLNPGSEAKASSPFSKCPERVDPQHWADFRKNRKNKRCTDSETAYQAVLRDLENFSDDEWPPGRLVQRSAENGWARIVNPRESKYDRPANQQCGKTAAAIAALGGLGDHTPM